MKVMFVVHRMHPNLTEVHDALVTFGHQCVFVVAGIGPSEPEVFEDRIVADPEVLSRTKAHEIIDSHQPDLVVQRNIDGPFVLFWKIAQANGVATVLYTQDPHEVPLADAFVRPLRVIRLLRDLLEQRIVLGPHTRVTPVRFWGKEGRLAFPHSEYLPFPAVVKNYTKVGTSAGITVLSVAKHGQTGARFDWLLRSLREAKQPFKLVIVGASPSPSDRRKQRNYGRLLQSIRNLGQRADYVSVHENLGREAMETLYNTSNVFSLPQKRHYMAISPLEAMSHGLPVLASSDGGASSYIFPVGSEQIFRARSYRDFRNKLFRLLEDENLRKILSDRALKYLEHTHSPTGFVTRLVELARVEADKLGRH